MTLAAWVNRNQQDVITNMQEENRILKRKRKGRRIRFTDDKRRHLAVKGKALGRKVLREVGSIVTSDTILRRHKKLIAQNASADCFATTITKQRSQRASGNHRHSGSGRARSGRYRFQGDRLGHPFLEACSLLSCLAE